MSETRERSIWERLERQLIVADSYAFEAYDKIDKDVWLSQNAHLRSLIKEAANEFASKSSVPMDKEG